MVTADPDVSVPAALIGDPTRAVFLAALTEARALPASELAARAGVSAQTASGHLTKLVQGGLLTFQRRGRQRYYRLADPAIAAALEALAAIAPRREPRSLRESDAAVALRAARTCYDHLAGRLGVALTDALVADRCLVEAVGRYAVTERGAARLAPLGVNVDELAKARRALARPCLDWSERRPHVAGALGAALTQRLFDLRWIERARGRAVRVTDRGRRELREQLGVKLGD